MIIGTVRVEEARVFDREAGFHQFHNEDRERFGSFEVFWQEDFIDDPARPSVREAPDTSGWYWASGFPGCVYDSDPVGPFASSTAARADADPQWLEQ